jgi:hypothetical protein
MTLKDLAASPGKIALLLVAWNYMLPGPSPDLTYGYSHTPEFLRACMSEADYIANMSALSAAGLVKVDTYTMGFSLSFACETHTTVKANRWIYDNFVETEIWSIKRAKEIIMRLLSGENLLAENRAGSGPVGQAP